MFPVIGMFPRKLMPTVLERESPLCQMNMSSEKHTQVWTEVNKGLVASMSITTHSMSHIAYDPATPQRFFSSICAALNSDTEATPLGHPVDDDVSSDVAEHKKPGKEQREKGFALRKKKTTSTHRVLK